MAIVAASIESNGWVLRLDVTGVLGNFANYTLDPDGSPRVRLASSHPGFVKSAGTAIAGTLTRALIATKPLRLPVNPASPTVAVIDETDLGGGTIRVRLALSEHIYGTDTGLTLAVLAGWRTGEPAASGIAVTNGSTTAAPLPIMRWALVPYDVTAGSFRLSLFVASHHPVGFEPVAGVKFTATDGTTTKTVWATALGTDNSLGDNLRCYTVIIDPATATALTAGLLRCDAEVYPWLGAMRTTDPAGTRSMASLRTDALSVNAASPFAIAYDPAGTRYGQQFAYVDAVNGTITASAAMVATTLAGAKAVAAASRPRDVSTAIQAGYLANRTLTAANGQAAQTRSVDGMQIVLAPGTSVIGATAVTTGIATAEVPLRIIGDPDDANPRANCIFNLTSASINLRATRIKIDNFTLGLGTNTIASSSAQLFILDRITGQGRTGLEANATAFWAPTAASTQVNLFATRTKWWRHGASLTAGNIRPGLLRACEHSRVATALTYLKNRFIGNVEDSFVGTGATYSWIGWGAPTLAGQVEDIVLSWNDIRFMRARAFSFTYLPATTAGTPNVSMRRHALIGNVMERIGASPEPLYSMGEDESLTASYNIIEGNTHVGERANTFYSDPLPTTAAEANTLLNQAFVNRVANNIYDWLPTKHDDFNDPQAATARGTANGYRAQMVEAWPMLYGVGHEANVDTGRVAWDKGSLGNFKLEYSGPRSRTGYTSGTLMNPAYVGDSSTAPAGFGGAGAAAAGGGNYLPTAASPMLALVTSGNSDVDFAGRARQKPATTGAYDYISPGVAITGSFTTADQVTAAAMRGVSASGDIAIGGPVAAAAARGLAIVATIAADATVAPAAARGLAATGALAVTGNVTLGTPALGVAATGAIAVDASVTSAAARALAATGALAVTGNVTLGIPTPGVAAVGAIAVNASVAAAAARGFAATGALAVTGNVTLGTAAPVANPWSIRFGGTVTLGTAGADMAAALATRASITADLAVGASLGATLSARATVAAALETRTGLAANLIARASITANLGFAASLSATLATSAVITAALATQTRLAATLTTAGIITASLDTARPIAASLTTRATLSAALQTGRTIAAQLVVRTAVSARLFTRAAFPAEPAPGADLPRATQNETLDALIWRVTGHKSIEAVLAANPGLADLGAHLPQGQIVDVSAADQAAAQTTATRELVQLWD